MRASPIRVPSRSCRCTCRPDRSAHRAASVTALHAGTPDIKTAAEAAPPIGAGEPARLHRPPGSPVVAHGKARRTRQSGAQGRTPPDAPADQAHAGSDDRQNTGHPPGAQPRQPLRPTTARTAPHRTHRTCFAMSGTRRRPALPAPKWCVSGLRTGVAVLVGKVFHPLAVLGRFTGLPAPSSCTRQGSPHADEQQQ